MLMMDIGDKRPFETADEIITSCRGIAPLTKARLAKWHRAGLIERPTTVRLGRGKGSESRYPLGTTKLVVALLNHKKKRMKTADFAWDLWWAGLPVPTATIRRILSRFTDDWDKCLTKRDIDEDLAKIETQRLPKPVARIRKRVGRENVRAVAEAMLSVFTDRLDPSAVDAVDPSILDKAFDLKRARTDKLTTAGPFIQSDQNDILRLMQPMFRGKSMAATLGALNDEQIRRSRDEYRAEIGVLDHASKQTAIIHGKGAFGFDALGALAVPENRRGQQFITIAWPLLTADKALREGADTFLSNEEVLTKTDSIITEIEVLRKNVPEIAGVANVQRVGAALRNKRKQARLNADARRAGRKYRKKIAEVLNKHRAGKQNRKKI